MKFGPALLAAFSILCATAASATAADTLYWTNYNGTATVSAANSDGSGSGRDLYTGAAARGGTVSAPAGISIDPASGSIYWSNSTSSSITRGSLESCDAASACATDLYPLLSGGPVVNGPGGPAIDVAHGLMYWMNVNGTLVRASLDGSGAVNDTVNTSGATTLGGGGSGGLVIDPRNNRIYWTNDDFGAGSISWANLDGSGGGDLDTTGANIFRPWGLALDLTGNRLYWASYQGSTGDLGSISWANLDGSGGGDLYTSASPGCDMLNGPNGIAIDRVANKIYWANFTGSSLSSANFDGSGGCSNISSVGATMNGPDEVALLKAPVADTAPTLTGKPATGKTLTCSAGTWGGDSPEAFLFRAPQSTAYLWKKNGSVVSGATGATFTPTSSGSYTCASVATNNAGSTTSAATALSVKRSVKFAKPRFKHKIRRGRLVLSGKISPLAKPAVSSKDCRGSVAIKVVLKKKKLASKRFALKYKHRMCSAAATLKLAKKYSGKKVKLTLSISKSTKLTATPKTVSLKL